MATSFQFGNKKRVIPGTYSRILSGIKNVTDETYGVLVIDTGTFTPGFVGGAGINGQEVNGKDAIFKFASIDEYRDFARGSMWWKLGEPLFFPNGQTGNAPDLGVGFVLFARASTTVPGEKVLTFTGGGLNGGTLTIDTRDEGVVAKGIKVSTVLTRGYGITMEVGVDDPAKFVLKFYRGSFTGLDTYSQPFDGIAEADTVPVLLSTSIEFDNISEVIDWMLIDEEFNTNFRLKTSTVAGTGAITTADMTTIMTSGIVVFTGTNDVYNATDIDLVLDAVAKMDYDFVLTDQYGDDAQSTENTKVLTHIKNEAKYEKIMVVGGGKDSTKFTGNNSSIDSATYFNSDNVVIAHGDIMKTSNKVGSGFKTYATIYKAALVIGRLCGLAPQVPATFKPLSIDKEVHQLNDKEIEKGLKYGVLMTAFDEEVKQICVVQGVNTIQNNTNIINEDGTTFAIQIKRIALAINKMLIRDSRKELFANPVGTNRSTLSERVLTDWISGKLQAITATDQVDNLILRFEKVIVTRKQDSYFVSYGFVPNGEVTKIFFSGFLLDN